MSRKLSLLLVLLAGCATPASAPTHRGTTQAVLWVQSSAEYPIAVREAYMLATLRLEQALTGSPRFPAIVMDLDETILDNSVFEARQIASDTNATAEEWNEWLSGTEARAMPGAIEFLEFARRRGVFVYFVTNRHERFRASTLATLAKLGVQADEQHGMSLLMFGERTGWVGEKGSRRAFVAERHSLLLVVGNDLNDFVDSGGLTPVQRRELAQQNADKFGKEWILIPSPIWGTWMDAIYDYREDLNASERRAHELKALQVE
jgi:acid phosphatase